MLPLTAGFLLAGPLSGILSDRFGSRPFATGGMLVAALSFGLLELLPINFGYPAFALLLLLNGLSMGAFGAPNRAGVMNSLPEQHRGAGAGMNSTFQNTAQVLSIGIFFTLMILGLASRLPATMAHGLVASGVPVAAAERVAHLPPVSTLFAAFLGENPIRHLLGARLLAHLPRERQLASRAEASSLRSSRHRFAPGCTRPSTSPSRPVWWLRQPHGCAAVSSSTPNPVSPIPSPEPPAKPLPTPRSGDTPPRRRRRAWGLARAAGE